MTKAPRCDVANGASSRQSDAPTAASGSMQDRLVPAGALHAGTGFSAPARLPGGQRGALHLSRP
jgi:hypothetical protein